jgi:lysophospholipase L1-like esterase
MISNGENSDLRYNFFYPRWAYDDYRTVLEEVVKEHNLPLIDAWDWVDARQFTNSAIHMNATAEQAFAQKLADQLQPLICP